MTTVTEARMLLLSKDDFDAISKAVSALSSLVWRLEYQREIKVKLPVPDKLATVLPLSKTAAVGSGVDYGDDF